MSRRPISDPRRNVLTAQHVDHALQIVKREGIDPALIFMETVGVPRQVAVRVLASPIFVRAGERRTRVD
jgi:hypothetical protein